VVVQFNKAETLEDLSIGSERADEALAGYTKALELQPALVDAHIAIAKLLIKRSGSDRKSLEEAREHYNQAIEVTTRTIEQYGIRKSRTSDAHALKMLDIWTEQRREEKANLDKEVSKLNGLLASASPTGDGVKNK
jgi:tetratricopeptide (TPR) repeat protein